MNKLSITLLLNAAIKIERKEIIDRKFYSENTYNLISCMTYMYYIVHEEFFNENQLQKYLLNIEQVPYNLQYQICDVLNCKRIKLVKFKLEKIKLILRRIINNNTNIVFIFKKYYIQYCKMLNIPRYSKCNNYNNFLRHVNRKKIFNIKKKLYIKNQKICGKFKNKFYIGVIFINEFYTGSVYKNGNWITVRFEDGDIQDYHLETALNDKIIKLY